jgi:hypothetical protein
MKFQPSVRLFLWTVLVWLMVADVCGYLWQGLFENFWWSPGYILSLAIPTILVPCILWVMFVPRQMDVSDDRLRIRSILRGDQEIGWKELKAWGNGGEGIFMLQFRDRSTFQIALFAFPREQRRQFIDFLNNRFPQRKARIWLGPWGFRG